MLANLVAGHPDMRGLSVGLNGTYDVQGGAFKNLDVTSRLDLASS